MAQQGAGQQQQGARRKGALEEDEEWGDILRLREGLGGGDLDDDDGPLFFSSPERLPTLPRPPPRPASTYQVFVRLAWCQRTEVFGCDPGTTLRNLKMAIYTKVQASLVSERLFRHFLHLSLCRPDAPGGLTAIPPWQSLDAEHLEDKTLAALGISPGATLTADLREPTPGGARFAFPSLAGYAADVTIRLPPSCSGAAVGATAKGEPPFLLVHVANIRQLPTAPRQFMAAVMTSARWTTAIPAPPTSDAQAALWRLLGGSGAAPGMGDVRWKALLETTQVSIVRPGGSGLMDGGLSKEVDCEQAHRDRVVALMETVAAANKQLATSGGHLPSRHELWIVGPDGEGSCCATFAHAAWHCGMIELTNAERELEIVDRVCRAVTCPRKCLNQVFARLPKPGAHRSFTVLAPLLDVYNAFATRVGQLSKEEALAFLKRLAAYRCPRLPATFPYTSPASTCLCVCPSEEIAGASMSTTTCCLVRRVILDQFLCKVSFDNHELQTAGVQPTPCLVRALLDGVEERGGALRRREGPKETDTVFGGNARAIMARLHRCDQGADMEGTAVQQAAIWALLESPYLFAPHARPLRLFSALYDVLDHEDQNGAYMHEAALLNSVLDCSRPELLFSSTGRSQGGGSSGGGQTKGAAPKHAQPRPPPEPASAAMPLPTKIATLVSRLAQGVEMVLGPPFRPSDIVGGWEEEMLAAVAGGLTRYVTTVVFPFSSKPPPFPAPLSALQALGRTVTGYLTRAPEKQQQHGQQQGQQQQPPRSLPYGVRDELIRLLAALLALEQAAALTTPFSLASFQLVDHVAKAITAAADRCKALQPLTVLEKDLPDDHTHALDSLTSLLHATWLADPWSPPGGERDEEEEEDVDDCNVIRKWLNPARAAALDPTSRGGATNPGMGFLLLGATWQALPALVRVFGPALQSPESLDPEGDPRFPGRNADLIALLFALAHHTPLHLPPPPLRADDGDEAMDGTVGGMHPADLRGLATDYAAFVRALQQSLSSNWVRALAAVWSSELCKRMAFSLVHALAFVDAQPSRRRAWERLQQRIGEPVPAELQAWWGWSWRDSVVARPTRERMIQREIAALDRRTYEAWQEGREEKDEDDDVDVDYDGDDPTLLFKLQVERADPLGRAFTRLVGASTESELRGRGLIAFFHNEPAYGPGVRREAVEVLWGALAKPGYCLLEGFQEGRIYYPSPLSAVANPGNHLQYFVFLGRLLAFALRDQLLVPVPLPSVFFKLLSCSSLPDAALGLEDLRELDPEMHRRLARLLVSLEERMDDGSVDDWGLTFSLRVEAGSVGAGALTKTLELIPGGNALEVTEANREEYVQAYIETRLRTGVREQLAATRDGLLDLLPLSVVQALSPSELQAVICGAGQEADPLALHPDRWKEHVHLEGYDDDSPQILWLWEFLEEASVETRARLLRFITGSSRLPVPGGFAALEPPITIEAVDTGDSGRLPVAHTCARSLDLPEYSSKEVLKERIALAIAHVDEEFGLA